MKQLFCNLGLIGLLLTVSWGCTALTPEQHQAQVEYLQRALMWQQLLQPQQPAFRPPVTCQRFGNMVTCR